MKYLVATQQGQGIWKNDFFWCNEGEPVFFGTQCSRGSVDDSCGCRRSLCGAHSAKATTTMRVTEVDACETINAIRDHYKAKLGHGR